jgi:lipopolysaccharide exporter
MVLGKSIFQILLSNIFVQIIVLLSALILVRLYPPEAFGIIAFSNSIMNIFAPFTLLKLNLAIARSKNQSEADGLLMLCFRIAFYSSLSCFLLLSISPMILTLLDTLNLDDISDQKKEQFIKIFNLPFLLAISILMGLRGINRSLQDYAAWHDEFKQNAKGNVYSTLISKVQSIGVGFIDQSAYILFGSNILHSLLHTLYLMKTLVKSNWRNAWHRHSLFKHDTTISTLWQENIDIPKYQLPSMFFLILIQSLPTLLFSVFYPLRLVGCYGQCIALISMPLNLINDAVSRTFYPTLSKSLDQREVFRDLVLKALEFSALICSFPMLLLWYLGVDFFELLLGQNYRPVGQMAVILAPAFLIQQLFSPLTMVYNTLKLEKTLLKHTSINATIRCIALFIAILYVDIYQCLMIDAGLQVLLFSWQLMYILNQSKISLISQVKGILSLPMVALVVLSPLFFLKYYGFSLLSLPIFIAIFFALAMYLVLSYYLYPALWETVKQLSPKYTSKSQ